MDSFNASILFETQPMLLERNPNCIVRAVDDFISWSGLQAWLEKQNFA